MDKFSDHLRSAPPGTFKPTTVAALLRQLNLTDVSQSKKTTGIRDWLADNKPSPLMEHSVRRSGYADLLR